MLKIRNFKFNEIKNISIIKFVRLNLLKGANIQGTGLVLPFRGTLLDIQTTGKLIVMGLLKINTNKIKGSKAQISIRLGKQSVLRVNGEFMFYSQNDIRVFNNAQLTLGSGYMNHGGVISCYKSITIGEGVKIARNVFIYDSDLHKLKNENGMVVNNPKPIVIGNHVWIGSKATILKGVTIGDGAVVAAHSLVNRDVPPCCLVAGVPAKIIKENIIWE